MTIEQINTEIKRQMEKYKEAYQRSKIANSLEEELCQREMGEATQKLCELLAEKRRLKGA